MNTPGSVIACLRKEKLIDKKHLYAGILHLTQIRLFEEGEESLEKAAVDQLFQRLGVPGDQVEMLVTAEDLNLYKKRCQIIEDIAAGRDQIAREELNAYETILDQVHPVHRQFLCICRCGIAALRNQKMPSVREIEAGIHLTFPGFQPENPLTKNQLASIRELELILLLAWKYRQTGQTGKAVFLLNAILTYLDRQNWSKEARVKITAETVYALSIIHFKEIPIYEIEKILNETLQLLTETSKGYYVLELFEAYQKITKQQIHENLEINPMKSNTKNCYDAVKKHVALILHAQELLQEKTPRIYPTETFQHCEQYGDVIHKVRLLRNLTMNETFLGTISEDQQNRMERSLLPMQFSHYEWLIKRLDCSKDPCRVLFYQDERKAEELYQRIHQAVLNGTYESAFERYQEIRSHLKRETKEEQQWILLMDTYFAIRFRQLSLQEGLAQYRRALGITVHRVLWDRIAEWSFSWQEWLILFEIEHIFLEWGQDETVGHLADMLLNNGKKRRKEGSRALCSELCEDLLLQTTLRKQGRKTEADQLCREAVLDEFHSGNLKLMPFFFWPFSSQEIFDDRRSEL